MKSILALSLIMSSLAMAQVSDFKSSEVLTLRSSPIVPSSVKLAKVTDMKDYWHCKTPCYTVEIEFIVTQPQTNFQFAGLAAVEPRNSSGYYRSYQVMTAELYRGAAHSFFDQTVQITLPVGIFPVLKDESSITLNGKLYRFTLTKNNELQIVEGN